MKVIEIDKDKKVVWEFAVPNDNKRKTATMRQVRRLDNGNTLISASTEDKVIEVSPEKKIVWTYDVPFPYLATRLANGNTLISSGDGYGSPRGWFVIEVDPAGKTVWKYGGDDAPKDQQLQLAQRAFAVGQRQHADRRSARRRHPRGVAGQADGPRDSQPGHATPVHDGAGGGVAGHQLAWWLIEIRGPFPFNPANPVNPVRNPRQPPIAGKPSPNRLPASPETSSCPGRPRSCRQWPD